MASDIILFPLKIRYLIFIFACHFSVGLAGVLGLYGWALAQQDAGTSGVPLEWLEVPLRFVMLQPLAHWLLDTPPFIWWTWSGLVATTVLLLLNSLLVCGALAACFILRGLWRRH